jgi:hypothetical protein
MRRLAFLALVALPPPAAAQCLAATALGRGVVVSFDNGDMTTMQRMADGAIRVDEVFANGNQPLRLRAARGIYYFEEFQIDEAGEEVPGSRLDILFPVPLSDLPEPAAGVEWSGSTLNRFADGTERPETTTITFLEGQPVRLSGCDYDTLDVAMRYDWGREGGLTLRYAYLPAIGIGLVLTSQFDGAVANEKAPVGLTLATK